MNAWKRERARARERERKREGQRLQGHCPHAGNKLLSVCPIEIRVCPMIALKEEAGRGREGEREREGKRKRESGMKTIISIHSICSE
jgi:hypothetical protein